MRFESYWHMKQHPVAEDYMSGRDQAVARFDAPPPFPDPQRAWQARAKALDLRARGPAAGREAVAEAVLQYNRKHNPVPEALRAAELLRRPDALVVVGGQQAGLFTGPMMVIYKAITILRAAQDAERRLGRPVVPIFWIAGEDHDWDEANHLYLVTPQLALRKVDVPHPESAGRTAVSRTMLPPEAWEEALRGMDEALQPSEFKPGIMEALRNIAAESETLSDAFAKTMSLLFGKHGLVLIDADDAGIRAVEGPMFRELAARRDELVAALKEGERRVAALGYPLQAEAAADSTQLFMFDGGERKQLYVTEDGTEVADRKRTVRLERAEFVRLAGERPDLFSTNALTRPLMQEYLFPVLGTVLGPSEIAYWSLLREAFALFGYSTPVIVPRQQFTLLEGTVQKQMNKFGLTFDDAFQRYGERLEQWLKELDELGLADQFAAVKDSFAAQYRPLIDLSASIHPSLGKLGETNLKKILEHIGFLEKRVLDALKARHESGLRQWERVRITVAPDGRPQERIVNIFQYIVKYGFGWLDELIGAIALDLEGNWRPHEIVYL